MTSAIPYRKTKEALQRLSVIKANTPVSLVSVSEKPIPKNLEASRVTVSEKPTPKTLEASRVTMSEKPLPNTLVASRVSVSENAVPKALQDNRVTVSVKPLRNTPAASWETVNEKPQPNTLAASVSVGEKPLPNNLEEYLPWACRQLEIKYVVEVRKQIQVEIFALAPRDKQKQSKYHRRLSDDSLDTSTILKRNRSKGKTDNTSDVSNNFEHKVLIDALYNAEGKLVHIRVDKNVDELPRQVLQILNLIIKFHPTVTKFTMSDGLRSGHLLDIAKMLTVSNITEIILDDCFLPEANYYILLNKPTNLMHLSLCRCNVNDVVLETITNKLVYHLPASKTLSLLNLSSNLITDVGAKYIAKALRSNRKLKYLNLADNKLTDTGAESILATFKAFPLTEEEVESSNESYLEYAKKKTQLVLNIYKGLKEATELEKIKANSKKRTGIGSSIKKKQLSKEEQTLLDEKLYVNAEEQALLFCGPFEDPFRKSETVSQNSIVFSNGNNSLCYLNISYNELTYLTLKMIYEVLYYQGTMNRTPRGLVNLRLEGNPMPVYCQEITDIQTILEGAFMAAKLTRKSLRYKSRPNGPISPY